MLQWVRQYAWKILVYFHPFSLHKNKHFSVIHTKLFLFWIQQQSSKVFFGLESYVYTYIPCVICTSVLPKNKLPCLEGICKRWRNKKEWKKALNETGKVKWKGTQINCLYLAGCPLSRYFTNNTKQRKDHKRILSVFSPTRMCLQGWIICRELPNGLLVQNELSGSNCQDFWTFLEKLKEPSRVLPKKSPPCPESLNLLLILSSPLAI